jgi:ABC-type multidrug transport system permease subunit
LKLQSLSALVKIEIKKLIREPSILFLNLLFPAVLTIVFLFAFSDPELGMDLSILVPGLIVYAVIFIIMTIAQSFSNERQQGLLKRLSTTPMTSSEFMGSRIISNLFIAVIQVLIVVILAFMLGFRAEGGIIGILLALPLTALFSLSSVGLGLITATISKTPEAATGISFIFILPQMFFGTFIPITETTRQIATFMPSYYLLDSLKLIFEGNWWNQRILTNLIVLSVVSFVIIALGVILFSKYGKK